MSAAKEVGRFDASTGMIVLVSLRCDVANTPGGVGRIDAAEKFDETTQHDATLILMQLPHHTRAEDATKKVGRIHATTIDGSTPAMTAGADYEVGAGKSSQLSKACPCPCPTACRAKDKSSLATLAFGSFTY